MLPSECLKNDSHGRANSYSIQSFDYCWVTYTAKKAYSCTHLSIESTDSSQVGLFIQRQYDILAARAHGQCAVYEWICVMHTPTSNIDAESHMLQRRPSDGDVPNTGIKDTAVRIIRLHHF